MRWRCDAVARTFRVCFMEWFLIGIFAAVPDSVQWLGFALTVVGAGFSLWAALSARGAKTAIVEFNQIILLEKLLGDFGELEAMLERGAYVTIAGRVSRLAEEIVRFQESAYNLDDRQKSELGVAHQQMIGIIKIARDKELLSNRKIRICGAIQQIRKQLSRLLGVLDHRVRGRM